VNQFRIFSQTATNAMQGVFRDQDYKPDNVSINVTMRHVRATIATVEKQ